MLRGDGKQLNENLAPLRRFLERRVGRPWDAIYSEIAANLRVSSTVQQHVRDHVDDFVAVKPQRVKDGLARPGWPWWQAFYVDPLTGLLLRTDDLPEVKAAEQPNSKGGSPVRDRVVLSRDRELRRIRGVWFELQTAPLPRPIYKNFWVLGPGAVEVKVARLTTPSVRDVVARELIPAGPETDDPEGWAAYRARYPERRYVIKKRTLAREELRRHGLANAPGEPTGS